MSDHPVKRAAALAGGYEGLAKLLGVTRGAVHQWTDEGRQVPAEHCPAIERITNSAVICEELNDKVDWAFVREAGANAAAREETHEEAIRKVRTVADPAGA